VVDAQTKGCRIALETSMDINAAWSLTLLMIEPEGARRPIATVAAGDAKTAAH